MEWAIWNVTNQLFYTDGHAIELYSEDVAFCKACIWSMPLGALSTPVWRAVLWNDEAKELAVSRDQIEVRDTEGAIISLLAERDFSEMFGEILTVPDGITVFEV